jgi:hypothetical protein
MQKAVEPEDRKHQTEQNADYRGNCFHHSILPSRSLFDGTLAMASPK